MANLRVNKIAASGQITENTGSVFFDGSGDYLIAPSSNDFSFDADFTIEFWVNTSTFSVDSFYRRVISTGSDAATSIQLLFYNGSGATSNLSVYSNAMLITGDISVATGDWVHVALSRSGTSMKLFVNGAQSGSTATTSQNFSGGATNGLIVGKYAGGNSGHLNGYISNIRICKGHAVYKSNFVVPTRELEVHPETVFLACYDGENIFAEKTGKVIAAYGDRLSSPTPTATDSPIGITTNYPPVTRSVDPTAGPTFQGGAGFVSQNWLTLPKGTTTERFVNVANNAVSASSARGIIAGGGQPTERNTISYINIASTGGDIDFGDLSAVTGQIAGCASATRGVFAGGSPNESAALNTIEYITISTTGDAQDFGDLTQARRRMTGCALSNSTKGVISGGFDTSNDTNTIEYITIATTGNSQHFGDLTAARGLITSFASPTRGINANGYLNSPGAGTNTIDYLTISSQGNSVNFGDRGAAKYAGAGVSNATRGVMMGADYPTIVDIDYIAIATTGNAQDFGDLVAASSNSAGLASLIRGVKAGGANPGDMNNIEYIAMATLGNATDFGDLTQARGYPAGCSNGHGGLG